MSLDNATINSKGHLYIRDNLLWLSLICKKKGKIHPRRARKTFLQIVRKLFPIGTLPSNFECAFLKRPYGDALTAAVGWRSPACFSYRLLLFSSTSWSTWWLPLITLPFWSLRVEKTAALSSELFSCLRARHGTPRPRRVDSYHWQAMN